MKKLKLDIIAGARPNFVKIASIIHAINKIDSQLEFRLIHTGQHYDYKMSGSFFEELKIPHPDINLGVSGGTQVNQLAEIMIAYEKTLKDFNPTACLVVGDVNSTMACSLVAKTNGLMLIHVEGGIRSNDLNMPEEINRMVTDSITDIFYTTTNLADQNLLNLGVDKSKIKRVGNTMIDTLLSNQSRFTAPEIWFSEQLAENPFIMLTMHRPRNVDKTVDLLKKLTVIATNLSEYKIIFPIHHRTAASLREMKIDLPNVLFIEPLSYLEFNYLVSNSALVLTDSGGITEETTVMGIPCMTLRDNTERPETINIGTNELIGTNPEKYPIFFEIFKSGKWKKGLIPELWDGQAGERIVKDIIAMHS